MDHSEANIGFENGRELGVGLSEQQKPTEKRRILVYTPGAKYPIATDYFLVAFCRRIG
jgi:hypothetical protein